MSQPSSNDRRLPVVIGASRQERRRRPRDREHAVHGAFSAQLLGQSGARRGLKGGRPVIDQAHGAYLGAEWSGSADRRRALGSLSAASV